MIDAAQWLWAHIGDISAIVLGLLAVAELVVRLTPTEKDDGAVERIGQVIRKLFDFLAIPNTKK